MIPQGFPESIVSLTNRVITGAPTRPSSRRRRSRRSCAATAHLQHRAAARQRLPGAGELPAPGPPRLLRAVRRRDGRDGPGAARSRPGSRSASCPASDAVTSTRCRSATCTRGRSSTSPATAGCASNRPRPSVTGTAPDWTIPSRDDPSDDPSTGPERTAERGAAQRLAATSRPRRVRPRPTTTGGCRLRLAADARASALAASLVLVLLAAPATIRVRRRSSRLSAEGDAAEQVESAWAEIRDTVVDHGGVLAERLATRHRHRGGRPARALGVASGWVRSPPWSSGPGTPARSICSQARTTCSTMTTDIRRGIAAPKSAFRRALAVVFPRSVFPRWLRPPVQPPLN